MKLFSGVGIHVIFSVDGSMRLGPNVKYIDIIDYAVDENAKAEFYRTAQNICRQFSLMTLHRISLVSDQNCRDREKVSATMASEMRQTKDCRD